MKSEDVGEPGALARAIELLGLAVIGSKRNLPGRRGPGDGVNFHRR